MEKIKFYSLPDLGGESNHLIKDWADELSKAPHTFSETPENLKGSLHGIIVTGTRKQFVAGAGIFPARTKNNESIIHNSKIVVELGSNIVLKDFRRNGIGKALLIERLKKAQEMDWFPVSVSTNKTMHRMFLKLGAKPMDNISELAQMRKKLCICAQVSEGCKACPLQNYGGWTFENIDWGL